MVRTLATRVITMFVLALPLVSFAQGTLAKGKTTILGSAAIVRGALDVPAVNPAPRAITTTGGSPAFLFVFSSGGGFARLNLTGGGIQFCALITSNGSSASRCARVGSFPVADLPGAQMTFPPGHIVITSPTTGAMVDCAVGLNETFFSIVPYGSCITLTPGS
jgi:hypothetical protein